MDGLTHGSPTGYLQVMAVLISFPTGDLLVARGWPDHSANKLQKYSGCVSEDIS